MNRAPDIATTLATWLRHFENPHAASPAPTFGVADAAADPLVMFGALAALAAKALAQDRTLWIVTADDCLLPEISNALDLNLRPLCLVMPGADYAGHIALRATLSLLKSRLTRATSDNESPAWSALRHRLHTDDALWRACLAWTTRGLEREQPPAGVHDLFPVRIGPWMIAQTDIQPIDWVVLLQSGQLPDQFCTAWPGAQHTLLLKPLMSERTREIVPIDETTRLRTELDVLAQELAELELELSTVQGELAAFSARYHEMIAGRMTELDRIHSDLAQVRMQRQPEDQDLGTAAQQAAARAAQSQRARKAYESREPRCSTESFSPGDDLKRRFRQLAQKIHPDRASDEDDRTWRTQLMSEANRAYRAGDAAALDEVLSLWLEGQQRTRDGAVPPVPISTAVSALEVQLTSIRRRISVIGAELDRLYGSKLYELFTAARMAERQGRDLLAEMAAHIEMQIAEAQAELDTLD